MIRPAVFALALVAALPATAQDADLRRLDTANAAHVWRAVGRIDLGGQGFCTGTLIAPDLVLTAAHCLYRPGSDETFAPEDIVFHAGMRDGRAEARRSVVALAAHARFDPRQSMTRDNVMHDVGLLRLATPIESYDIAPFALHEDRVEPGPVSVVSYGRGRESTQSRQADCSMTRRAEELLIFDCAATFGSSGSPVFSHINGRGRIMSVISGIVSDGRTQRTVGMHLPQRVAELRRQLRIDTRLPAPKVRRLGAGERVGTGAKFVRPGGS